MFTESKGCFARPVACSKSWTKFVPCTNNCVKHVNACVNRKMNYNPGQNHWDNWRTVNPDIEFIFVNWNPPHPNQCWWSFVPSQVCISLFKPTLVRGREGGWRFSMTILWLCTITIVCKQMFEWILARIVDTRRRPPKFAHL